jgi:hypothetical protein
MLVRYEVNFDLENFEWKKLLFVLGALFSTIPLHVASFSYALPTSFAAVIDAGIRASIGLKFATELILFGFMARYIPQFIYGLASWSHKSVVEAKYYRRGYRRIYVAFTGFGAHSRKFKSATEISEHFRKVAYFGRQNARFSNLLKSDLHKISGIQFYETHRNMISAGLTISMFSLSYIGLVRGIAVILLSGLFAAAAVFYSASSTAFRFSLSSDFWDGYEKSVPNHRIDVDDILIALSSIAFAADFVRISAGRLSDFHA